MPFARVNPGDLIQSQNLDQLVDSFNGVSGKGIPVAETSVNDATNYALSVQNLDATNSRALNVLKSDGTLLIRADVNGVSLGTPLNPTAGSIQGTALANGTVANVNLGPDVARANLLTNGGFDVFQRPGPITTNGVCADRWTIGLAGGDTMSASADGTNQDTGSVRCLAIAYTRSAGPNTNIVQTLKVTDGNAVRGRTLSLSARVRGSVAGGVYVQMSSDGTGGGGTSSTLLQGLGTYETLTVAGKVIPVDATQVNVTILFVTSGTYYFDNFNLVVGSQPANYVPLHPADDLNRCLRYYEIHGTPSNSGQTEIALGQCFSASAALVFFKYAATKPVTPTLTSVGAPSLNNSAGGVITTTSASSANVGLNSGGMIFNVASGLVAGNATRLTATGTNQYVTIESNP